MNYPRLVQAPHSIGAAAYYSVDDGINIPKLFTKQDKYGEEFVMYEKDTAKNLYMVPRNCAPHGDTNFSLTSGKHFEWHDGFVPRDDEQLRMVEESAALLKSQYYGGHIMRARTGYGKTYLGSAVIQRMGFRSLVITTKEDILEDWKTALSKTLNIDKDLIGEWRGDVVPEPHHQVVVGLVQSICKGPSRYPEELYESFGLVVVDEVQRMGAEKFSQAMWWLPARYRLGLSATPFRKDDRDEIFHAHIGSIDVWTDDEELIPKVICADTEWQVPVVWNYQTRKQGPLIIPWERAIIAVKYLQADEHRNQIIANFVQSALKKCRRTVIMSDTVAHLQSIKDKLMENGIRDEEGMYGWYVGLSNASVYKAALPKDRYTGYKKDLREKATKAKVCLATYKMCSEGTNVPWWDTIVLATPKADVEQPVGRIRRYWPDKQQPVVLDLCDYNHRVTATFAKKRMGWYESIGAEIIHR